MEEVLMSKYGLLYVGAAFLFAGYIADLLVESGYSFEVKSDYVSFSCTKGEK